MQTIHVIKDFVLTLEDSTTRAFKKGEHVVDDSIAAHWYVQAHTEKKPLPAEAETSKSAPPEAKPAAGEPAASPPKIPVPPVKTK